MTVKMRTNSDSLRTVAVLLATAVILPTVCLLWFMMQAVKNERLAVRQKLETMYRKQCEGALDDSHIQVCLSRPAAQGLLVYDDTGKMTFPVLQEIEFSDSGLFEKAYALEFQEGDLPGAMEAYRSLRDAAEEPAMRIAADIAIARCLAGTGRTDEAIEQLEGLIAGCDDSTLALRSQTAHAFLLLLDVLPNKEDERFEAALAEMWDYITQGMQTAGELQFVGEPDFLERAVPSELQVFALSKYKDYAERLPPDSTRSANIPWAETLMSLLETSWSVENADALPGFIRSEGIDSGGLFALPAEPRLYGRYHRFRDHLHLPVFSPEYMAGWLDTYVSKFEQLPSLCRIYDAQGRLVTGSSVGDIEKPFITIAISGWLPGWTADLYVEDITFDSAADKQAAVYVWTGLWVVALILLAGVVAIQAVGRQIRMNRLKNDFIATVTHELKTPLSSMRVLVDTLLDGGYVEQQRCREYLEMIGRENCRLSRMIDSFLTFSRMERGKQVFDMQRANPAEIADAAAEAVRAKFQEKKCRFSVTADTGLSSIMADQDAMVTVLVNLLDNACKYSGDDKEISLRVFEADGSVCFSVTDNGIGMTKRQVKKIFDKFYQADTSLARRAEGCGLGLSIVKYIVDAHKGGIDVESKPGKGSVFTVTIPTQ